MNNKGFAIAGLFYAILLIFLSVVILMLFNLQSKKKILDKLKSDSKKAVEQSCSVNADEVVFFETYTTDAPYTFTVPCNGTYKIELWGASGAIPDSQDYISNSLGSYTNGIIESNKDDNYYIYIGQSGDHNNQVTYNGGGAGGYTNGASGGGATDIRISNGEWNNVNSLITRIMVAAGGGGSGVYNYSGQNSSSGGLIGYKGNYYAGHGDRSAYGSGGTQISGGAAGNNIYSATGTNYAGSFGIGGSSYSTSSSGGAAGGGGGWYGGGAGGGCQAGGAGHGGGGGSSYISGHTGCVAVTSLSDTTPKSGCETGTSDITCSYSPTTYKFINGTTKMIDGQGYSWTNAKGSQEQMPNPTGGNYALGVGHSGNGYAKITYLGQ